MKKLFIILGVAGTLAINSCDSNKGNRSESHDETVMPDGRTDDQAQDLNESNNATADTLNNIGPTTTDGVDADNGTNEQ